MLIVKIKTTINATPQQHLVPAGASLVDVLHNAVPSFSLPCGARQSCGKCLVWARGTLSSIGEEEDALLQRIKKQHPLDGYTLRLACFCKVMGNVEIILPRKMEVSAPAGAGELFLPEYDGKNKDAIGAACDVGTTTITMVLYKLSTGEQLATAHQMNSQGTYGADILSRIEYNNIHAGNSLGTLLRKQLNGMLRDILLKSGVQMQNVDRIAITGNTVMLHFLTGLDPRGIGVSPFTPESLFGEVYPAEIFFNDLPSHAELYLPPCISAYVGADITCGMLACSFGDGKETKLLVDVGTNGEMALVHKGQLICCATAAGPAFEGAEITMGMPATAGAIYKVSGKNGKIQCSTIEDVLAIGICGTGLISILSFLLSANIVDGSGRLLSEGHEYQSLISKEQNTCKIQIAEGVWLTQEDIRAIQLAKAAIAAGIETLLHHADITAQQVDQLLLAGGFGNYIIPYEAAKIGLVPAALQEKAIAAGNTALLGVTALLFSLPLRNKASDIAKNTKELSLSSDPFFMEEYIENMVFYEE